MDPIQTLDLFAKLDPISKKKQKKNGKIFVPSGSVTTSSIHVTYR